MSFTKFFEENYLKDYFNIEKAKPGEFYHFIRPNKEQLLINFVAKWKGIRQRDKEWYDLMGLTIGGSEIAAIMGKNKYSSREKVIADKVCMLFGENNFNGGAACNWGILFEDALCPCIEDIFETKIYGDSIVIQVYTPHRNSPDGYMVVGTFFAEGINCKVKHGDTGICTKYDVETATGELLLLLEFKCPHTRRVATVPEHYAMQVQSGLMVSPIADLGLFVDAMFRKCKLADLGTITYDRNYHNRDRAPYPVTVIAYGIILVFDGEEHENYIDFGDNCDFDQILDKINKKEYTVKYMPINQSIIEPCLGIIPWNLYELVYTFIERDTGFFDRVMPVIEGTIKEVQKRAAERKLMEKSINCVQKEIEYPSEEAILALATRI